MTSEVPIIAVFIIFDLSEVFRTYFIFVTVLYLPTEFHAITYDS